GTRVYLTLEKLNGQAVISVKNTSREELNLSPDELMERFVRGDSARKSEGNGLGLSIARSLTELQRGRMELSVDGDLFKVVLKFPIIP
ncbi:MAG: sensor histidine kinase, partial [Clostridium sp.]|nr:sensor histidine kinase [Clostridium sp.]